MSDLTPGEREDVIEQWRRLNAELQFCDPDDYDELFSERERVQDELDAP